MAQFLRALAAIPEDPGLFSSIHMVPQAVCKSSSRRSDISDAFFS